MPVTYLWLEEYGRAADYGDEIDGEWHCQAMGRHGAFVELYL